MLFQESFKVVMSMTDNTVLHVPCELLRMLRYPSVSHFFSFIFSTAVQNVVSHDLSVKRFMRTLFYVLSFFAGG